MPNQCRIKANPKAPLLEFVRTAGGDNTIVSVTVIASERSKRHITPAEFEKTYDVVKEEKTK